MMYLSRSGEVSKRRIEVLQGGEVSFRAFKTRRTFTIDNVLEFVPIVKRERNVN